MRLILCLLAFAFVAPAAAAEMERRADLMILESVRAPAAAAAKFRETVEAKGAKVIATVDHAAAAAKADLALDDAVLLVFGNPKIGTPLMQAAPTIAADLPLRALFWTQGGRDWAAVLDPDALAARHGLAADDPRIAKLRGALTAFLTAAAR